MHFFRARRTLFFVLLLAAVLLALSPGINAKMSFDARMMVYDNPLVTSSNNILKPFWSDFCEGCRMDGQISLTSGFYRPVVNAVYWLEYRFAGTNDAIYNFDEMLLHWVCALTVFFLAARLMPDKPLAPFIAATLFALHPANAYAATRDVRSDLLCLLFYLGAVIAYLRAFPPAAPPRKRFILLSLTCFLGAILSKEMGVTLPAVLVMLHFRQRHADGRPMRELLYTLPFWLLFTAYMAMRALLLPQGGASPYLMAYTSPVLYINAIKNFAIYLLRYILPLGAGYPTLLPKMVNFIDPTFTDPLIYLSLGLLILITGAALWNIRRHPTAAFLTFFMLVTMTPLTMVTRISDITDINVLKTPERFMYIPSVPLLLLASLLLQNAYSSLQKDAAKKGAAIAGVGAALFLGSQSNTHTVAINSDVATLKNLYLFPEERLTPRMLLMRECLYVLRVALPLRNFTEAEQRLVKVLKNNPSAPLPYMVLGNLYMQTEEWNKITPLILQWNRLDVSDLELIMKNNPTILSDYMGVYRHFPYLLAAAATHRGEARQAADYLCSALQRGFDEQEIVWGLRENYLLNGPPQCRTAQNEALCRKNASIPDFAEWRQPLDPKRCKEWKTLF